MGETVVKLEMSPLFSRFHEQLNEAFQGQLEQEAEMLLAVASSDVPERSGTLAGSAFTDSGPTARGNPAATVGYESPIAAAVHEGFHGGKKSETPHQFWLQQAANDFGASFTARMADIARGVVE